MELIDGITLAIFIATFLLTIYNAIAISQLSNHVLEGQHRTKQIATDITHVVHTVDIVEKRTGTTAVHLHELQSSLKPIPMTISPLPKLKQKMKG